MRERIRTVTLRPFVKGQGPTFTISLFDTGTYDDRGCTRLGYSLTVRAANAAPGERAQLLACDEGFYGSPLHADDSLETVAALVHLLAYGPGDECSDDLRAWQRDYAEACCLAIDDRLERERGKR